MKVTDKIQQTVSRVFSRGSRVPKTYRVCADFYEPRMPFADTIFLNCCELLTDLCNDVELTSPTPSDPRFIAFRRFYTAWGCVVLNKVKEYGIVVIGHTQSGEGAAAAHYFHICHKDEYRKEESKNETRYISLVDGMELYVMRSQAYMTTGQSDKALLGSWLELLDNVMNAANTSAARLGSVVVASPKNVTSAPTPFVLREDEKKALEKEIGENYGALSNQKSVMLLPREMSFQVISLASLDHHTADKAKLAILAIADRLKVPANQIGIVDANSSKSLANGTEMREGDFNKYQSFERLLDQTFIQMARDIGIKVDYTIYNKPERQSTTI